MASVNKVILVGNLGADPEVKAFDGKNVCNFSIATSDKWKDKDGKPQEKTEWTKIAVWGPQADACAKYLKKGSQAYVEGKLQTRKYEKDGVEKYATSVVASSVQFIGAKPASESKDSSFDKNEEIPF